MKLVLPLWQITLGMTICLLAIGCGKSEYDWATARGSVTIDGQPVPKGSIRFSPIGETRGPVAGTRIENGQYLCEKIPAGQHSVNLIANAAEPRRFVDAEGVTRYVPRSILPPRYNEGLSAELKPGDNQLDFALSNKGP